MRLTYRAAGPVAAAAILTLLCGCSRTQQDWRAAQQAGTPQAYRVFVQRHPDSELAGVARQRMARLAEDAAWQQAVRENTAAAFQQYLAKYPNGSWSQDARIRMQSKSLPPQAPQAVQAAQAARSRAPIAAAVGAPAGTAGRPGPAASPQVVNTTEPRLATSSPDGSGSSAVQLGAFSTSANARTQWRRLSSKFPAQLRALSPRVVPVTLSGRRLYRLEARVASRAAARRLCRQLQQHSQGCLPLP